MMKSNFYRQCVFKCGEFRTVAWIDETAAIAGFSMKFVGDVSHRRWTVIKVGQSRQPETWVKAHERDYLKQRQTSDI